MTVGARPSDESKHPGLRFLGEIPEIPGKFKEGNLAKRTFSLGKLSIERSAAIFLARFLRFRLSATWRNLGNLAGILLAFVTGLNTMA